MATANQGSQIKRVGLLLDKPSTPPLICNEATVFYLLKTLIAFVFENSKYTEVFDLIIPGHHLEELMKQEVYDLPQVHTIEVFYESDEDLKRAREHFQQRYTKLDLYHIRNLEGRLRKLIKDRAISRSGLIDRTTLCRAVSTTQANLVSKLARIVTPPSSISQGQPRLGYDAKNKHEVHPKYICSPCDLILRDPCQLICGHRQCQSCVWVQNMIVSCSICYTQTLREHVWIDRGFQNEIQGLVIECLVCDWTGTLALYQEHIDQSHSNHLTMFEQNEMINCSVCNEQVVRNKIQEHFLTETHQNRILKPIFDLNARFTTHRGDQEHMAAVLQVRDLISVQSNTIDAMHDNIHQLKNESLRQKRAIENLTEELQEAKRLCDRMEISHGYMQFAEPLIKQECESLKQHLEDSVLANFNGSLTWKIDNVHEKMRDARSERQPSIYSRPFFSSRHGYKMCMRFFPNGDGHARDTHMSIFLHIMRGDFDAILRWPFNYQVKVHLLEQFSSGETSQNITDFFWPDITSSSFQQPSSAMNVASGIPKFVPLWQLNQNRHRYIQNDTMFIKMEVDLVTPPSPNLSGTNCIMVDDGRKQATVDDNMIAILD